MKCEPAHATQPIFKTNMDENEVRGEDLDAILDLLESDFFEEKISTFLDETVEEVNIVLTTYSVLF